MSPDSLPSGQPPEDPERDRRRKAVAALATARRTVAEAGEALDRLEALGSPDKPEGELTAEEARLARDCVADVYRIQADDDPEPNAATLTWRKLRVLSGGSR